RSQRTAKSPSKTAGIASDVKRDIPGEAGTQITVSDTASGATLSLSRISGRAWKTTERPSGGPGNRGRRIRAPIIFRGSGCAAWARLRQAHHRHIGRAGTRTRDAPDADVARPRRDTVNQRQIPASRLRVGSS